jgi:glutaredoxin 3
VKEFLSHRHIKYVEYDISRDGKAAQELLKRTGRTAVPVIIIDGEIIIGYDRDRLEEILDQKQEMPKTLHPSFGALVADAGKITLRQGVGLNLGAYVGDVKPGSLAEKMGLKSGDIIVEVNKQGISNAADLESVLSRMDKGSYIAITLLRGEQRFTAEGVF